MALKTYKGWACKPSIKQITSTSIAVQAAAYETTAPASGKYVDCPLVGATGKLITAAGSGCCMDMVVSTISTAALASTSGWTAPYTNTLNSQMF